MRLLDSAAQYDHLCFGWCQRRRSHRALIGFSRQISRSADGYLYIAFGLVLCYFAYFDFAKAATAAFVIERGLYFGLKKYVRRNRPPEAIPGFQSIIQASDKFSFPSGHTSAAFLMVTLTSLQFPYPVLCIVLYAWAGSVAWSRVMLGVHFPSDTLAGASLGTSIALTTYCLYLQPPIG